MSDENEDKFWSKLGERLGRRAPEAAWAAQKARVLGRLKEPRAPLVRVWVIASAAAACALAALGLNTLQRRIPQPPALAAAPAWEAVVSDASGDVTIVLNGQTEERTVAAGSPVERGDEIRTGADGRVVLALSAEGIVDIGPNASLKAENLEERHTFLDLTKGSLVAKLHWLHREGKRMEVRTPSAVAAVRGTEFGVEVAENGNTDVAVFDEGKVAVRSKDAPSVQETTIEPRQEIRVPRGAALETAQRGGRSYLPVRPIERLERHRERLVRIRERQDELRKTWTRTPREARQRARVALQRQDARPSRPGAAPGTPDRRRVMPDRGRERREIRRERKDADRGTRNQKRGERTAPVPRHEQRPAPRVDQPAHPRAPERIDRLPSQDHQRPPEPRRAPPPQRRPDVQERERRDLPHEREMREGRQEGKRQPPSQKSPDKQKKRRPDHENPQENRREHHGREGR